MNFTETPLLRIGYKEWNPEGKRTIVLAHGWPDSLRCWHEVAPLLVAAGYRVIAPALRGFLPTTFLSDDTPRTGQLAALGRDMVDFVQALQLDQPGVELLLHIQPWAYLESCALALDLPRL